MDLDPRRVVVGVMSLSMAVVGLLLSVLAPVLGAVIPHMKPRMPAVTDRPAPARRGLPASVQNERRSSAAMSNASGSGASVKSNVTSSAPSSRTSSTSTLLHSDNLQSNDLSKQESAQDPNSEGGGIGESIEAIATQIASSGRGCMERVRRIGSTKRLSINLPPRKCAVSEIEASNSQGDLSEGVSPPADPSQERNEDASFAQSSKGIGGLFNLKRRTSRRKSRETTFKMEPMTSLKEDTSLSSVPQDSTDNEDQNSSVCSEPLVRRSKSTPAAYLAKLRGKGKRKEAKEGSDGDATCSSPEPKPLRCRRSSTKSSRESASPAPPPRTRPYEAPYNFPSPVSPEAQDYAKRTRSEILRASQMATYSPSTKGAKAVRRLSTNLTSPPRPSIQPNSRHSKSASESIAADELGFTFRPRASLGSAVIPLADGVSEIERRPFGSFDDGTLRPKPQLVMRHTGKTI